MTREELLRKLDEAGATGLDLSPGDEVCAEAARVIRSLETARTSQDAAMLIKLLHQLSGFLAGERLDKSARVCLDAADLIERRSY